MNALPLKRGVVVWEPHCGDGSFVRALRGRGCLVIASDVEPALEGASVCDFLALGAPSTPRAARPQWVVGNPPFAGALAHIRQALAHTGQHVVFVLRLGFLASARRLPFWRESPPRKVWVLPQRPSFTGGSTDSADYMVVWWDADWVKPTEFGWLDWKPSGGE